MQNLIYIVILVTTFCPLTSFSQEFGGSGYLRRDSFQGGTYTYLLPKQGKIVIVGELTKPVLETIQTAVIASTAYKDIFVDSQGGDAESTLEIADIINRLNLRLIVNGRCFSACAFLLFPAAKRKIVLRSGIVGIHEARANFLDKGVSTYLTGNEIEMGLMQSQNIETIEKVRIIQEKMRAFNVSYGLNNDLLQIFNAYLTRRKQILGTEKVNILEGTANCPRILMWVLKREQLEKMGVRGIESFWYPETKREKEALIHEFGTIANALYFGEPDGLKLYCNTGVQNWFKLQWYKLTNLS